MLSSQLPSSLPITTHILTNILDNAYKQIQQHQLIQTSQNKYCLAKFLQYSQQIQQQQAYSMQPLYMRDQQQKQPFPLEWDNMFPTDVDLNSPEKIVEKSNKFRSNYGGQMQNLRVKANKSVRNKSIASTPSISVGTVKKNKLSAQLEKYEKLNIPDRSEEENIYKELRNQILQEEEERKLKQQENLKKIKQRSKQSKNKDQKLGFAYDGSILKLSMENRNRLVDKGIDGELHLHAQKTKQIKGPGPTAQIEYARNKNKKLPLPKSQIQFTDIKTLFSDAEVTKGIKLVEGGVVIEEKKRVTPLKELKELMMSSSVHRFSKEEYRRVKQSMGHVAQYEDLSKTLKSQSIIQKTPNKLTSGRSASQSKISQYQLTKRRSTITISDPQLFDNMLYGPINQAQQRVKFKQQQTDNSAANMDAIDHYNIEYMKNGGNSKKKSKSVADLLKLPKVRDHSHASQFGSTKEMPRGREKIREGQGMIREIRKRFQEKLRI